MYFNQSLSSETPNLEANIESNVNTSNYPLHGLGFLRLSITERASF